MDRLTSFSTLGWNHDLWSLVRYFRSLRLRNSIQIESWLSDLKQNANSAGTDNHFPVDPLLIDQLESYIAQSGKLLNDALIQLRTEEEAIAFCTKMEFEVGTTATENKDHHQSSKALIAAVSMITRKSCDSVGVDVNLDPQRRAIWFSRHGLHVSARNLDGAIPSLENPKAIWEIKEYWGKTKGGSKMSDAVYECQLVGMELRLFEVKSAIAIDHIVFVDGLEQWHHRKSDLLRFIDLHQQGLIDHLIIGREVETIWPVLSVKIAAKESPEGLLQRQKKNDAL